MSSVEPTSTGPEPQSIVARNEKSAGSGGGWLAEAVPASASESTAVTDGDKGEAQGRVLSLCVLPSQHRRRP